VAPSCQTIAGPSSAPACGDADKGGLPLVGDAQARPTARAVAPGLIALPSGLEGRQLAGPIVFRRPARPQPSRGAGSSGDAAAEQTLALRRCGGEALRAGGAWSSGQKGASLGMGPVFVRASRMLSACSGWSNAG